MDMAPAAGQEGFDERSPETLQTISGARSLYTLTAPSVREERS